ncbi:Deoxythymidylate kinase Thymidylate kinase [Rhodotorula toruloides ATCC 204091]|uniref:Thymidylate kinase n=1 Tax=Rhodotorula toruloides TaxID=5286 RepID=A0A0K3CH22_RHOTO|nr:Deoxythymidylate kinase Thymidylate kinase [Rhodotorula toruloides ATCC 204091]PRQ73685.1 Deoxythymidylate kinase [Rhodotorula toruloides]
MATTAAAPSRRRGAFIVFEGLDRSGKSTQVQRLVDALNARGVQTKGARFPDRTLSTGKMIDSYLSQKADLDDRAIHLLFSANRWERASQILEDLRNGVTVVCDRYAFSGIAFSAIKGLSWNWCRAPDVGLPQPDLVLFLRVSPEVAQQRGGFGQERYETSEVQAKVEKAFTKLGQSVGKDVWTEIDADKGVDEVHEEIVRRVEQALGSEALDGEVKKLWEDALGDEKD